LILRALGSRISAPIRFEQRAVEEWQNTRIPSINPDMSLCCASVWSGFALVGVFSFFVQKIFRHDDLIAPGVHVEIDLIHERAHEINPQAADAHLREVFFHVRRFDFLGIEAAAMIGNNDGEFLIINLDGNVDIFLVVFLIGVLNDIGARLVHRQFDLADGVVFETDLPRHTGNKLADELEIVGLAGDTQLVFFLRLGQSVTAFLSRDQSV